MKPNKTKPTNQDKRSKSKVELNFEELILAGNGDNIFLRDMLSIFVKSIQDESKSIDEAYLKSDWIKLANSAHKISPACKHLHAKGLHELLLQIEQKSRAKKGLHELAGLIKSFHLLKHDTLAIVKSKIKQL